MASQTVGKAKRRRTEGLVLLGLAMIMLFALGAFAWSAIMGHGPAPIMGLLGSSVNRVNILILGVDERTDDSGRSDTMMVAVVDPKAQDVSIISVPRDTRVKIPDHGYDKINHAYAFGKYQLSQRTVENLLGLQTSYYILIDFNGFKRVIDAIGGVTIDVEKRMYYYDPYDEGQGDNNGLIDLKPGVQHMDGNAALQYVRYRDEEGDIGRIQRQQKFMKAVMQQVTQPSMITRIPALIRELSGAVRTNMSVGDMISYAKIFDNARKQEGVKGYMVPGTPVFIDDISYWVPDIMAMRKMVAEITGTNMDERALAATNQMVTEYEQSLPKGIDIPEHETKTTNTAKDKSSDTKSDVQRPPAKNISGRIRAEVINASGNDEAVIRMTSELRRQGFDVVSVVKSSRTARMTTVVDHTDNETVIKKVNSLPFDYNLSILRDGVKNADITVIIGKDYR